jgi:hypothetical protein
MEEVAMSEAYTDERLAREARIEELTLQLRELAQVALPGTYSSDAFLIGACTLYAAEQVRGYALVAAPLEIVAPGAAEEAA